VPVRANHFVFRSITGGGNRILLSVEKIVSLLPETCNATLMLQRIQTLYLLFTCGLLASLFFIPMCETPVGARDYSDSAGLLILLILSVATSLGTLFLYRRRTWQIRLCIFNSIVLTGFQGWIACYFFTLEAAFSISAVFPLAAVLFTVIAARYIARDEAMVRNTGRIRN
ncbi:MAG: DUF4293 domain-containing protein, partial [Prevotellaceae bacterium]|nr:DUF4293 domain-containing protein [Prevotellaceae bacterium]